MSVKNLNVPLSKEQQCKVSELMGNLESLAEITRMESVNRVVNHLLEDKPSFVRYLTGMAGLITKQRQQITCQTLNKSIFHARQRMPLLRNDLRDIISNVVDREREIQNKVFIAENHLQVDIHNDIWKLYEKYGETLKLMTFDFSLILSPSLRYELKHYLRYVFEHKGKVDISLFCQAVIALNALIKENPKIKYFSDITEVDARALLLYLETTHRKDDDTPLSQTYICLIIGNVRRIIDYLMSDMRNDEIKTPQPYMNPFANFIFYNERDFQTPTAIIPEDVTLQINKHSDDLTPVNKLLYDIFINTGLRLKEVMLLEADCIEESRYDGIFQLKFKPHKVLAARRRHGIGDYHRVMITQPLADEITCYINDTAGLREDFESSYIFLSQRHNHRIISVRTFISDVQRIIVKYDIRDENGELWHLTSRQFRKTLAVTLIENGATTSELAYWLGHMSSKTAAIYYADVRKMKLAELNTRFFKEKFDLILSGEQLENYTEEERKLLYIDFRLEQRRVELGYCLMKAANGRCSNRNSLYNCVNCKSLCTGKKYLSYWRDLLTGQEEVVENFMRAYRTHGIKDYTDFAEYKQELRLLKGYENIVISITEEGGRFE